MTRKDYKEIAEVIKAYQAYKSPEAQEIRYGIAEKLCVLFKRDNDRFDKTRFMDACGFDHD